MDYYHVLRVPRSASKKEIEHAHDQLLKEARYDVSIDPRMVESAYRILIDPAHKTIYDLSVAQKAQGGKARRKKIGFLRSLTRKDLLRILAVLVVLTSLYYLNRYSHLIKRFDVGDTIYMTETNEKVGKIVGKESGHNFGSYNGDAFLIKKDSGEAVWLLKKNMQIHCNRKK